MAGKCLIDVNRVGKNYPKLSTSKDRAKAFWAVLKQREIQNHHVILKDISLKIHQGESLGLIGVNGAGKSTLLKMIAGVVKPSSGTIETQGRIGALLELGAGFHPEYTGRDNIMIAGGLLGVSEQELKQKLDSIIAFAGLGDYIDEPIKHYSSGMVVRLGFSVVTAIQPDLLITDEVLAVGDESFQKKCIRWMEQYLAQKGTLVLCTHSMYYIQKLCSKACWIHDGTIRAYGDAFDVTQAYLSYHERLDAEESNNTTAAAEPSQQEYRLENIRIQDSDSSKEIQIDFQSDLIITGHAISPDDRPPVIAIGFVRAGNTPVYGAISEIDGFTPNRIESGRYGFRFLAAQLPLLPGEYTIRLHTMDPEGMRIFDTHEWPLLIRGQTREIGMCRFPHEWERLH